MPEKHTNKITASTYGFARDEDGRLTDSFIFTPGQNDQAGGDKAQAKKSDFVDHLRKWMDKDDLSEEGLIKELHLKDIMKVEDVVGILNREKMPNILGVCYMSAFMPPDLCSRVVFKNRGLDALERIQKYEDLSSIIEFTEKHINQGKIDYLRANFETKQETFLTKDQKEETKEILVKSQKLKSKEFMELFRGLLDKYSEQNNVEVNLPKAIEYTASELGLEVDQFKGHEPIPFEQAQAAAQAFADTYEFVLSNEKEGQAEEIEDAAVSNNKYLYVAAMEAWSSKSKEKTEDEPLKSKHIPVVYGDAFRFLRYTSDKSVKEIAYNYDVSDNSIYRIELGVTKKPYMKTSNNLIKALCFTEDLAEETIEFLRKDHVYNVREIAVLKAFRTDDLLRRVEIVADKSDNDKLFGALIKLLRKSQGKSITDFDDIGIKNAALSHIETGETKKADIITLNKLFAVLCKDEEIYKKVMEVLVEREIYTKGEKLTLDALRQNDKDRNKFKDIDRDQLKDRGLKYITENSPPKNMIGNAIMYLREFDDIQKYKIDRHHFGEIESGKEHPNIKRLNSIMANLKLDDKRYDDLLDRFQIEGLYTKQELQLSKLMRTGTLIESLEHFKNTTEKDDLTGGAIRFIRTSCGIEVNAYEGQGLSKGQLSGVESKRKAKTRKGEEITIKNSVEAVGRPLKLIFNDEKLLEVCERDSPIKGSGNPEERRMAKYEYRDKLLGNVIDIYRSTNVYDKNELMMIECLAKGNHHDGLDKIEELGGSREELQSNVLKFTRLSAGLLQKDYGSIRDKRVSLLEDIKVKGKELWDGIKMKEIYELLRASPDKKVYDHAVDIFERSKIYSPVQIAELKGLGADFKVHEKLAPVTQKADAVVDPVQKIKQLLTPHSDMMMESMRMIRIPFIGSPQASSIFRGAKTLGGWAARHNKDRNANNPDVNNNNGHERDV